MNPQERAVTIKQLAFGRGFDFCGIAKARYLEEESPRVEMWLNKGYHGKMQYMENHFDKRLDPCKSFAMGHTDLTFSYAELGIGPRTPLFLLNPFYPWTGPGS